jgi:hypothetical protein
VKTKKKGANPQNPFFPSGGLVLHIIHNLKKFSPGIGLFPLPTLPKISSHIISQPLFAEIWVFPRENPYLTVIQKPIACHYFPRFRRIM